MRSRGGFRPQGEASTQREEYEQRQRLVAQRLQEAAAKLGLKRLQPGFQAKSRSLMPAHIDGAIDPTEWWQRSHREVAIREPMPIQEFSIDSAEKSLWTPLERLYAPADSSACTSIPSCTLTLNHKP